MYMYQSLTFLIPGEFLRRVAREYLQREAMYTTEYAITIVHPANL